MDLETAFVLMSAFCAISVIINITQVVVHYLMD